MHPRHRLLAFLLFNLLWAIVLFSFVCLSNSSKPVSLSTITVVAPDNDEPTRARSSSAPTAPATKPAPPRRAFTWRDVETEDYAAYLARLREAGCPEAQARRIVLFDVNERA